ncbi:MAG: vanadium-dependent haloperoxidase [Bacteroidia bacterium]|nr:vanadium-dependent haloperoxidase [Bacteroidia bacterium]
MKRVLFLICVMLVGSFLGCKQVERKSDSEYFHDMMQHLTDVIVDNIFSPPAASRVYTYPSIAAYEALQAGNPDFKSLAGQLNELGETPKPDTSAGPIYFPLASLQAFTQVSKAFVFTESGIDTFASKIFYDYEHSDLDRGTVKRSKAYGDLVAQHIIDWSNKDGYKEIRGRKHTLGEEDASWKPTGPAYMEAIEPYWNSLRTFIIDSATQFVPARPTTYSTDKKSRFFEEMMEVYETKEQLTDEQAEIAAFWDCNPYVMNVTGHVMYATKKITPGGHWIAITKLVSQKADLDMMHSVEAYTRTSIALADAFISCWDEKYRSNLIRPETVIQELVDPTWQPLLQTPPFPEYTSGHSVISTAAALALTELLGDNFAFIDSSETSYGLPSREFDSFVAASEEAAISRLYGGIHYMPAIRNGQSQGRKVGNFINKSLVTKIE